MHEKYVWQHINSRNMNHVVENMRVYAREVRHTSHMRFFDDFETLIMPLSLSQTIGLPTHEEVMEVRRLQTELALLVARVNAYHANLGVPVESHVFPPDSVFEHRDGCTDYCDYKDLRTQVTYGEFVDQPIKLPANLYNDCDEHDDVYAGTITNCVHEAVDTGDGYWADGQVYWYSDEHGMLLLTVTYDPTEPLAERCWRVRTAIVLETEEVVYDTVTLDMFEPDDAILQAIASQQAQAAADALAHAQDTTTDDLHSNIGQAIFHVSSQLQLRDALAQIGIEFDPERSIRMGLVVVPHQFGLGPCVYTEIDDITYASPMLDGSNKHSDFAETHIHIGDGKIAWVHLVRTTGDLFWRVLDTEIVSSLQARKIGHRDLVDMCQTDAQAHDFVTKFAEVAATFDQWVID